MAISGDRVLWSACISLGFQRYRSIAALFCMFRLLAKQANASNKIRSSCALKVNCIEEDSLDKFSALDLEAFMTVQIALFQQRVPCSRPNLLVLAVGSAALSCVVRQVGVA